MITETIEEAVTAFDEALAMLPPELRRKGSYTVTEASVVLGEIGAPTAPATMNKMRSVGGGPPFWKPGASVRYPRDELIRWGISRRGPLLQHTSESSTK